MFAANRASPQGLAIYYSRSLFKKDNKTNIKKYLSATLVIKLVKHMQLFLKKSVLYKISFEEMKKYF